jgi:hypothetical protein
MNAKLYGLLIPAEILQRGFWLYIWRIGLRDGGEVFYVGRTGDSSSLNAQSPFSRVSGHLGSNKRSNALRRHLCKHGIKLDACGELELVTYGPLFDEASNDRDLHSQRRDKAAALERDLCTAMQEAGYCVINQVHCRKATDSDEKTRILNAFAERFSALRREREPLPSFLARAGLADIDIQRIQAAARDEGELSP